MNVTVFVPIQLVIKGDDKLAEVQEQLMLINRILKPSELASMPNLNTDLVGNSEIVEDIVDETEQDIILVENGDIFDGSRMQFRDAFFDNASDTEITVWCSKHDWKLSINGKKILE
jgi:hypothetical protein